MDLNNVFNELLLAFSLFLARAARVELMSPALRLFSSAHTKIAIFLPSRRRLSQHQRVRVAQ